MTWVLYISNTKPGLIPFFFLHLEKLLLMLLYTSCVKSQLMTIQLVFELRNGVKLYRHGLPFPLFRSICFNGPFICTPIPF